KRVFAKASEGDLTVNIAASTKDEFKDLAESFNAMIMNISTLMKSVTESSETVLETSTILADMSQDVTASISEVARAIEEVSNGAINQAQDAQDSNVEMENLSAKLDLINENSNVMEKLSNDTKILSSKGLSMIDVLIDKSNHTKVSTTNVNTIVVDMYESAKQINAISDTLSSITSQTNLLSLNASIESARAGEAGRGFAVVANEIRLLAEQSTASTEDIKGIIAGIQKKTDAVLEAIQSTQAVVNEQDVAVNQTKKIFDDILVSIERMIKQVDEVRTYIFNVVENKKTLETDIESISAISEETASASEEVTASTEEITATMEEFTRYSVDLKKLANQLEVEINRFKI
ncbi:MAG TPA: HAMP domain-containing methyl-accepting chemotaxis protein, partial [Lachnospiraceae bacterium]|nr:HAMP domain-containing methyl-accepting chemotaxis protein [Lachnospiraceae bacterium]